MNKLPTYNIFHCKKIYITCSHLPIEVLNRYSNTIKQFILQNLPSNYTQQQFEQNFLTIDNSQAFTQKVKSDKENIGICLAASGVRESAYLNQIKGVRGALVHSQYIAAMCRQHNDANICIIPTDCIGERLAACLVWTYLSNEFDNEVKNKIRVGLLSGFDEKYLGCKGKGEMFEKKSIN